MSDKYPVHYYRNGMAGLTNNDAMGEFYNLIKAIFFDGFNTTTPTALTYDTETNLITIEYPVDHGYLEWQIIELSGATQPEFNGLFRVKDVVDVNILTVVADNGTPLATTATTSTQFACKGAPQGDWELVDDDAANFQLAMRPSYPERSDCVLRIRDNVAGLRHNGRYALLSVTQDEWVDFDNSDFAGSSWWPYSYRYTSERWMFAADKRMCHYFNRFAVYGRTCGYTFGEFRTFRPGDRYNFYLNGNDGGSYNWDYSRFNRASNWGVHASTHMRWVVRGWDQYPGTDGWQTRGFDRHMGFSGISYPNPCDYGYYILEAPTVIVENSALRGYFKGPLHPLQNTSHFRYTVKDDYAGFEGVPVVTWSCRYDTAYASSAGENTVLIRLDSWE